MEKHPDPFDDFIREALKGHELTPREKARNAFLDDASAIIPSRKGWKYWYFIPVLFILLSGLVAVLVFQRNEEAPVFTQAPTGNIPVQNDPDTLINTVTGDASASPDIIYESQNQSTEKKTENSKSLELSAKAVKTLKNSSTILQSEPISDLKSPVSKNVTEPATAQNENLSPADQNATSDRIEEQLLSNQVSTPFTPVREEEYMPVTADSIAGAISKKLDDPLPEPKNDLSWHISSGAYYLPELMFNTLEGNKFVHNTGIDVIFYHGLVSIRTGVGVSVSEGITRSSVEYNDYLGTYNKLDSITFIYNESDHNFEPNIFTSSQKVWDSVQQSDSTEIVKRYTYLQVPLVLGFDFWQRGKISFGVRIGTIMSVMLKAQQLTGEYDPGENLVVGISQLTPSQVSLNWQAIGGIAASAMLTRRVGFELEPQAKYYYGSIYEKSGNVKKPWSIGIRAAILYKF